MALSQAAFRFGIDEGTEATHGWYAAQNTNITFPRSTTFLLRFLCQASGGVAHSNIDWQFQYNRNAAGWNNITTSSAVAQATTSVAFIPAEHCTNRLTGGTGTFSPCRRLHRERSIRRRRLRYSGQRLYRDGMCPHDRECRCGHW